MDQDSLRSGQTYWRLLSSAIVTGIPLDGEVHCEVVVIGGGITGALVAYQLVEAGVDTIIVDREELGAGSTAASTGLLQYEIDTPLVDLIPRVGEEDAVYSYRRGLKAIDELEQIATGVPDSCDYQRRPAMYLASEEKDVLELREEAECRRHFGFDVELLEREPIWTLFGLSAPGAIWSRGDAEVDPYRFTQNVLKRAIDLGVRPYSQTKITRIQEHSSSVHLTTPSGAISARRVILATGYSQEFLPRRVGKLRTTYALASQSLLPIPQWPEQCLLWETARPYCYARTTRDGRAILGGEDSEDANDHEEPGLIARKANTLSKHFSRLFPGSEIKPYCIWAGTFAETQDGLPFIGPVPGHERVCCALGYGGNGITFSMIAARLLTDQFLGRNNPDSAVFRFGR